MKAINYHFQGIITTFRLLFAGKYLTYFIPGAVLTILFLLYRQWAGGIAETAQMHSDTGWIEWGLGYVNAGIGHAFSFFDLIIEQIYLFAVLTLLSPFNTSLGEKVDEELTDYKVKGGFVRFINDFFRMLLVVIIMLILEFAFMGFYWLLSWIIGGSHDPYVYFIISAFFFGLSFYDFALERYSQGVFSTIGFAFTNPLGMIITGALFLGIYNIPIVGVPLAPVLCVMISTVAYAYYIHSLPKKEPENTPVNE